MSSDDKPTTSEPVSEDEILKAVLKDAEDPLGKKKQVVVPEKPDVDVIPTSEEDAVNRVFQKFMSVAASILNDHNSDRTQLQETIKFLDDTVKAGNAQRVYVEMLVSALRAKVDTNANAVKLLDSFAKLLSAGKGTQLFVQQEIGVNAKELAALLKAAPYPDETKDAKD
jgi:hypothetical protein